MSIKFSLKKHSPLIVAALAVGVSGSAAAAGDNPFRMTDLPGGYQLAHQDEKSSVRDMHADGNSARKDKPSKAEHADDRDHEKGAAEGKCGSQHMKTNEGKCGGAK